MRRVRNRVSLETDVQFEIASNLESEEPSVSGCNSTSIDVGGRSDAETSELRLVNFPPLVVSVVAYRADTSASEACRRRWLLGSS